MKCNIAVSHFIARDEVSTSYVIVDLKFFHLTKVILAFNRCVSNLDFVFGHLRDLQLPNRMRYLMRTRSTMVARLLVLAFCVSGIRSSYDTL